MIPTLGCAETREISNECRAAICVYNEQITSSCSQKEIYFMLNCLKTQTNSSVINCCKHHHVFTTRCLQQCHPDIDADEPCEFRIAEILQCLALTCKPKWRPLMQLVLCRLWVDLVVMATN
ncbi:unnamed protein product [Protopolystoma xenopodis]|uniref:Uncharacterized protein n=1 Tax=Protopolystoma xenopodis TaxID=117903 RepID=A0A448X3E5_9PLAT|nr:unnamed protein product [Protopolystoma xenopodis]